MRYLFYFFMFSGNTGRSGKLCAAEKWKEGVKIKKRGGRAPGAHAQKIWARKLPGFPGFRTTRATLTQPGPEHPTRPDTAQHQPAPRPGPAGDPAYQPGSAWKPVARIVTTPLTECSSARRRAPQSGPGAAHAPAATAQAFPHADPTARTYAFRPPRQAVTDRPPRRASQRSPGRISGSISDS